MAVDYRGSLPWPWYEGQRLGLLPPAAAGRAIAAFAPDVLHLHSPLTLGLAARRAARRRGVPVIYTNHYLPLNVWPALAHATGGRGRGGRHRGRARGSPRSTASSPGSPTAATYVTAPTVTALRLLRSRGLRVPSQAVSNGVDLEPLLAGRRRRGAAVAVRAARGRPVIVSVGRLSGEKRADVLIAAMSRLAHGAGPDSPDGPVLALAGTGPDDARLRSLARHYGVADRVRFLGFVPDDDLPGLYRLADVFAIASQAELQSLATMAAMASGLPVVAVDAGALAELVHAGENGFLARPGTGRGGRRLPRPALPRPWAAGADGEGVRAHHRRPRPASPARPVGIHLPGARAPRDSRTREGERWPALNSRPCHCSSSSATPAGDTAAPPRPWRRHWNGRCPAGSSR